MEDILWYLHKFIDPKQYSLLSKKYRDIYFREKGIILKNFDFQYGNSFVEWMYQFLTKYKIHLHIVWINESTTPIYGITHKDSHLPKAKFSNKYTEKILENIISVTAEEMYIDHSVTKLLQKLPNLRSINGILCIESLEKLVDFLKIPNSTPELVEAYLYTEYGIVSNVTEIARILKKENIALGVALSKYPTGREYLHLVQRTIGHDMEYYSHGDAFPELIEILDGLSIVPNIIAPKLEFVDVTNMYIAAEIIKKYKTIKYVDLEKPPKFKNTPEFIETYNLLKEYDFPIRINIEDIPILLKLERSEKFIRAIYVKNPYGMVPKFMETAEKIFYVEKYE